jgi:transposase
VNCRRCGVVAEELPWSDGKHSSTKAHISSWPVGHANSLGKTLPSPFTLLWTRSATPSAWGLEHRTLESFRAIGVDEIQYAKGHQYLTLVYQIDQGLTRLPWVGKERTIESFQGFFALIGDQLAAHIQFVCSDMWQPYPDVIRQKCSQALHILDAFTPQPK